MKLTIHRGTHQIGGSIVEVATANTRLVLDVGMPLDDLMDPNRKKRPPQADPVVANAFRERVDAVMLSHAHADHSGLLTQIPKSVPLYLSQGTSKMLMALTTMRAPWFLSSRSRIARRCSNRSPRSRRMAAPTSPAGGCSPTMP